MSPITAEWVLKAEADYGVALRELRGRKSPGYDASCFHSQQSAVRCVTDAGRFSLFQRSNEAAGISICFSWARYTKCKRLSV